jgi:hypothetical protein
MSHEENLTSILNEHQKKNYRYYTKFFWKI